MGQLWPPAAIWGNLGLPGTMWAVWCHLVFLAPTGAKEANSAFWIYLGQYGVKNVVKSMEYVPEGIQSELHPPYEPTWVRGV